MSEVLRCKFQRNFFKYWLFSTEFLLLFIFNFISNFTSFLIFKNLVLTSQFWKDLVETAKQNLGWNIDLTHAKSQQIRPIEHLAGKYVWDHFWQAENENQTKGRSGTVMGMDDYTETIVWRSSKEAYLEPSRMSLMELFVVIVNGTGKSSQMFPQKSFIDVWLGSKYICVL